MQLETINCGNCGAPLQIPETANFVTCNHCKSSLAVKRMASVTLTEKLAESEKRLERTEHQLAHLVRQNRFASEMRRWERERERHMIKDKHGNKHVPSSAGGCVIIGLAILFTVMTFAANVPALVLIPIIGGGLGLWYNQTKVQAYQAAYRQHQQRLRDIPSIEELLADDSHDSYLSDLEHAPTPDDFLRELSEQHSN